MLVPGHHWFFNVLPSDWPFVPWRTFPDVWTFGLKKFQQCGSAFYSALGESGYNHADRREHRALSRPSFLCSRRTMLTECRTFLTLPEMLPQRRVFEVTLVHQSSKVNSPSLFLSLFCDRFFAVDLRHWPCQQFFRAFPTLGHMELFAFFHGVLELHVVRIDVTTLSILELYRASALR